MRIAFAVFKVFPHGGVARDLAKIVAVCLERGHAVRVYAMASAGLDLPGVQTILLPCRGLRSHVRQRRFAAAVDSHRCANPVDLLVGMNKMPNLDVYYAADSCFEEKARAQRPWLYRLTPRYRHFAEFERAVFAAEGDARVLTIAPDQERTFRAYYGTPASRFHALPPGIERDRALADSPRAAAVRAEFGVADDDRLLLFIGSGFVKKGLDRVLKALPALPAELRSSVRVVVVGADKTARFERLARRLGWSARVSFAGGRDDVPAFLGAADALVLPARDEAAGMVILEAAIAGVPVLATANCGYAGFIADHGAGLVTPAPFDQARFDADLARLLDSEERRSWAANGRRLALDESLYAMAPRAVDFLEEIGSEDRSGSRTRRGHRGGSASGAPEGRRASEETRKNGPGGKAPLAMFHAFRYTPCDPRYRDLVPVADACCERGIDARIYACIWEGDRPAKAELVQVPVAAMTWATREARFRRWVDAALLRLGPACAIGFDAQRGLAVDAASTLDSTSGVPLGIGAGPPLPNQAREKLRTSLGFSADDVVFVVLGGDLVEHGSERLLRSIGKLPEALRVRCGVLAVGRAAGAVWPVARVLGLRERTRIVEEGPLFRSWRESLAAADVLVALPYAPASVGWAFDAMAAGRAVLTHAGVAESAAVRDAEGGVVLPMPFRQADCDRGVAELAGNDVERRLWQRNAAAYASVPGRHGRARVLASRIEALCSNRASECGPVEPGNAREAVSAG